MPAAASSPWQPVRARSSPFEPAPQTIFGLRFGPRFKLVSDVVSAPISEHFSDFFSVSCRSSLPDSLRAVFFVAFGPSTWPLKRVSGRSQLALGQLGGPKLL